MKYLVLRRFRTYGVTYLKGDVIDESVIRSPRIRQSEGKIIPAVSSSEVPKEVGIVEDTPSKGTAEEVTIDEDYTREELEDRAYNELQSIAKDLGLLATGKKEELVSRILGEEEKPVLFKL